LKIILSPLEDVAQFLFVLPLFKLTENTDPCNHPNVLAWETLQIKLLKAEKSQK